MSDKYFPIKTATACQLKWAWSTIFLNTGVTRSCHRTSESKLTAENFNNFHNTDSKLIDRMLMLQGLWPTTNCQYCKKIEDVGGFSDRMRMMSIPDLSPIEFENNPTAINVNPAIVEVYFNNTCNLGCLYCVDHLSSTIASENKKHGEFSLDGVNIKNSDKNFKDLVPLFWKWFETGFQKVKRLHILGGEPFLQADFEKLLEMIERYPNPNCELNIVTNLMIPHEKLLAFVEKFKFLLRKRLVRRIDITCSIDSWGAEQEYVRWGIDLDRWKKNFEFLLTQKWLTLNINQTISPLTIKSMPELLKKLQAWRQQRTVGHFFSEVTPGPSYLFPSIFGNAPFKEDFDTILSLMPKESEQDINTYDYMMGIFNRIENSNVNRIEIKKLIIYLNEKDRRRKTNWREIFPWMMEYE
jgi:sulfatase maturation enzyme AslB (radical SAM superfamily)